MQLSWLVMVPLLCDSLSRVDRSSSLGLFVWPFRRLTHGKPADSSPRNLKSQCAGMHRHNHVKAQGSSARTHSWLRCVHGLPSSLEVGDTLGETSAPEDRQACATLFQESQGWARWQRTGTLGSWKTLPLTHGPIGRYCAVRRDDALKYLALFVWRSMGILHPP